LIKKPVNPCYKCEDRVVGCHAECEKYISYRKEQDIYGRAITEGRKKLSVTWSKSRRNRIVGR